MSMTLTGKVIQQLAEATGLIVLTCEDEDILDTEITLYDGRNMPVFEEPDGDPQYYEFVAVYSEHPEEGGIPLGEQIKAP